MEYYVLVSIRGIAEPKNLISLTKGLVALWKLTVFAVSQWTVEQTALWLDKSIEQLVLILIRR